MLKAYISKIIEKNNLTESEAEEAMGIIMDGSATQAQMGGFLTAIRMKGETVDEITGFARAMRNKAERIQPAVNFSVDTCGTGGDCANTINISTAAAFVAAAAGLPVAKHGNRSVSSKCGSADILEELGCRIDLQPEQVRDCIESVGIGFMFAPVFHKSMRNVAGARKELGVRTVFNILGPLTNPAQAPGQLIGVYKKELAETIANVLMKLGTKRALIVHGSDGLDEITISGITFVTELKDGEIKNYTISPEENGVKISSLQEIVGGDRVKNAKIIRKVLEGEAKGAVREVILLNSAAALYVGSIVNNLADGVKIAQEIIDSGKAIEKMEQLAKYSRSFG